MYDNAPFNESLAKISVAASLSHRVRRLRDLWRLRRSGLVDGDWYRAHDPQMTPTNDPVAHYLVLGFRLGREPGPRFSGADYLAANRDVAAAGLNPLLHYLLRGWAEGRPLRPGAHEPLRLPAAATLSARERLGVAVRALRRRRRRLLFVPAADQGGLAVPEGAEFGFGKPLQLEPERGALPTGWVLVDAEGLSADDAAALRVVSGGVTREAALVPAGRAGLLVRLPDVPAQLFLVCHRRRMGRLRADLAVREIGRLEGAARALIARGEGLWPLWRELRRGKLRPLVGELEARHCPTVTSTYRCWVAMYDEPSPAQLAAMAARAGAMPADTRPLISIIVPIYNPPATALREMIASVAAQVYPNWELCLADDASTAPHVAGILQREAAAEPRIRLVTLAQNGGISAASNAAIQRATGSWLALLDHDDVLAPHALLLVAEAIAAHPGCDLLYSDEDKLDAGGARYEPYFKPDFSPELLQGQNFINHLGVYRATAVRDLGGLRSAYDGSQDYDLALRVAARTTGPIVHIPHVLYHWRLYPGSGTFSTTQIDRATAAARAAIADAARASGAPVEVVDGPGHYHRVIRAAPRHWPTVTAIVPTRDHADILQACLTGLLEQTDYPALDILVADNASREPATQALFAWARARGVAVLDCAGPFNYAAINNRAAAAAQGELLLLLNNDISMLEPGWLKEMVALALPRLDGTPSDVGAVGAKLLYPDGTLQHAGVVLGIGGVAGHVHLGMGGAKPGPFGRLLLAREVGAVTAACMLVPARHFAAVGGFDAAHLAVAFNDVDLCLRLRAAGLRILWTPQAVLRHWESKSRGSDQVPERVARFNAEVEYMQRRWGAALTRDPFYSPNLSLDFNDPALAFPPRVPRPWDTPDRGAARPL